MNVSYNHSINWRISSIPDIHTLPYCQYKRQLYENLDSNGKLVLIILFFITSVLGVFSNIVVVFAIHKTNQLTIQSIKLFLVLSILDTFNSMSIFFLLRVMFNPLTASCSYFYFLIFVLHFGTYNSTFMIAVVALDRFLHIFYMQSYSSVFTAKRFKFAISITLLLVMYQASATLISAVINGPGVAGTYTIYLNVLFLLFIIVFYSMSLVKLRTHSRTVANISNTQRSILKITAMWFNFYFVNLASLLLYQFLNNWTNILSKLSKSEISVIKVGYLNIPAFIGTVNAFAFLWVNKKSRNWLKTFFRPNRITVCERMTSHRN